MCLKPEAVKAKAARLEKLKYYKASANTNCAKGAAMRPRRMPEALQALGLGKFVLTRAIDSAQCTSRVPRT